MALCGANLPFVSSFKVDATSKTISEYSLGDIIEFGSYPQSKVDDEAITAELDKIAPSWDEWISYGYMSGAKSNETDGSAQPSDYMRYCDVEFGGNWYRGVKFTTYRKYYVNYKSDESTVFSEQSKNGYTINNVYWFKYEPLKWKVIDPAAGLVLCEKIIDSQSFSNTLVKYGKDEYNGDGYWKDSEHTIYSNNYYESDIRQWLNNDFYNIAFYKSEKEQINNEITRENLCNKSTRPGYASESTTDPIFLFSYYDLLNTSYGFLPEKGADIARRASGTDYSKCQGLYVSTSTLSDYLDSEGNNCSYWLLNTAGSTSNASCYVMDLGTVRSDAATSIIWYGVRPAMCFILTADLSSEVHGNAIYEDDTPVHNHSYTSEITVPVTCTADGVTTFTCVCGDSYTESIPAPGHTEEIDNEVEPTCTESGLTSGKHCSVCGEIIEAQSVLPPLDHIEVTDEGTEPTCVKTGITEGSHCLICGEIIKEQQIIPNLGGTHSYDNGEIVTIPTESQPGLKVYTCTKCGETYSFKIVIKSTVKAEYHTELFSGQDEVFVVNSVDVNEAYEHDFGLRDEMRTIIEAYNIYFENGDGEIIQPENGKVRIYLKISDNINKDRLNEFKILHYYADDNGDLVRKVIVPEITSDGNYFTFEVDHFSEFVLVEEYVPEPVSVAIANNNGSINIGYKESVTLTAVAENLPENAVIIWFVNGEKAGEGETLELTDMIDSAVVSVKIIDENGNELTELNDSSTLAINVDTSFFAKVVAFFRIIYYYIKNMISEIITKISK